MSACNDAINANIATAQAFKTWKDAKQSSLDSRTVATDLPNLQANIFDTANCLNEKISGLSTLSTADSNTQLQIDNLQKKIDDEMKNKEISQHRLDSLKNKETSYYESWFPMERDIRPATATILLGISVALCFISLAYLLQTVGIYIFVKYIGSETGDFGLQAILQQFTIAFWIVLAVLIGVVFYFVYRK
jgi:hypothetical protein